MNGAVVAAALSEKLRRTPCIARNTKSLTAPLRYPLHAIWQTRITPARAQALAAVRVSQARSAIVSDGQQKSIAACVTYQSITPRQVIDIDIRELVKITRQFNFLFPATRDGLHC